MPIAFPGAICNGFTRDAHEQAAAHLAVVAPAFGHVRLIEDQRGRERAREQDAEIELPRPHRARVDFRGAEAAAALQPDHAVDAGNRRHHRSEAFGQRDVEVRFGKVLTDRRQRGQRHDEIAQPVGRAHDDAFGRVGRHSACFYSSAAPAG